MGNNIKDSLDNLKLTDVYSLILFALYKMSDIPEYSALSELVYVLDKESLFNFLSVFGGIVLRVPTIKELKIVVNALLLYQYVQFDGMSIDDALKEIETNDFQIKDVLKVYGDICHILSEYSFKRD